MKIPTQNRWTQTNEGDIFGTLNSTRNITIDNAGKLQLTKKSFAHYTDKSNSNFRDVISILFFDNDYVIVTSDEAFRYSSASDTFIEIASTPTMSTNGDAIVFNNLLYTMGAEQLHHWDGTTWTTSLLFDSLTNGNPHPMSVFDSNPTFKLAIGDGNQVNFYSDTHNIKSESLILPTQFEVTTMEYRNGYLYVGTRNTAGGEARVFIFNGEGTSADYEVPMGGEWVFALTAYGSTVAGVVDTGEVFLINGSAKQMLGAFPVFYDTAKRWASSSTARVNKRGLLAVRDSIFINIDGDTQGSRTEGMRSGLWTYNPNTGLSHTANISSDEIVKDNGLTLLDSTLTTSSPHQLISGDSVTFVTTGGLTGVDTGVVYYVDVVSSVELKLALSRKSLEVGNTITIDGTPGLLDKLSYTPNTDYGEDEVSVIGAIGRLVSRDVLRTNLTSDVFFAGRADDTSGTTTYSLCGFTDSYNIGSFTTQRIYSENISQAWKEIYAFIDGCNSSVEEIVIKHRTEKAQSKPTMQMRGTWGSDNAIHSDATQYDEDDWELIEEGDEIFVTNGYGQGRTAHVTKIEKSINTYVVTVDESFGEGGKVLFFSADNWKKTDVVSNTRKERDYAKTGVTPVSKGAWAQIKVELRGFQTKVAHLELVNSVDKSAV